MANIVSIDGNPIVLGTSGIEDGSVTLAKLNAGVIESLPQPTDAQVDSAVSDWLDLHPEATTTVEDGAITTAKLADGAVTDAKLAQTGGVLEAVNTLYELLDVDDGSEPTEVSGTTYQGFYLNATPAIAAQEGTRFYVIKYPVVSGKAYTIHGTGVRNGFAQFPLACFGTNDFDGTTVVSLDSVIIEGSNTAQDYSVQFTTVSNGYVYVMFDSGATTTYLGVTDNVGTGGVATSPYIPLERKQLKVQLFGDSITDEYWGDHRTWATVLPDCMREYDLTIINSAVGGSGWCWGYSSGGQYADKEHNYVNDLLHDGTLDTTADVIVILAGTNNWAGSYPPIGTFGDKPTFTPDTYYPVTGGRIYAAIYNAIEIISTTTDALLILVTPPQRYNSVDEGRSTDGYGTPINNISNTLRDVCDAIVTSAQYYGVPCVDLNSELGWNRMNVSDFTIDGLHPNDTGDEMIAQIISSEIKRHF